MSDRCPHFYKARCRIGLVNPPLGSVDLNLGVENAPDYILNAGFLEKFKKYQISEYDFPNPEEIHNDYFKELAKNLSTFSGLITKTLKENEIQVVVGGDDSVSFSSLLAVLRRCKNPKKLGYIRFDSHGDMNLYESSPTKNFHGMYHRPFFGDFDVPEISRIVDQKLIPENVLFIGNLVLDPEEKEFFEKMKIKNFAKSDLSKGTGDIKVFADSFEFLHIGFDIDVLDVSEAPATGIPADGGLLLSDVSPILDLVPKHPNLSLDLVEVNPKKEGAGKTIKIAQTILWDLLGN